MAGLGKYVSNFFKTAVSSISPYKVEEYTFEQYNKEFKSHYEVVIGNDVCLLYKVANYYDMLFESHLTKKKKVFSLFRIQESDEAIRMFRHFSPVLIALQTCYVSLLEDRTNIEKISTCLRAHPGWNAAHLASSLNFTECFANKGLAHLVNDEDTDTGQTALHVAIISGFEDLVQLILVLPDVNVKKRDGEGNTVFHMATMAKSVNLIHKFVPLMRESLNALNAQGRSPLHIACEMECGPCLSALLHAGADPSVSRDNEFPIHIAVRVANIELVQLLGEHDSSQFKYKTGDKLATPLHLANTKQMVDTICKLSNDIDHIDISGRTPLSLTVSNGMTDVVLSILIHNADPNIPDLEGNCPIHYAAQLDNIDILRALIVFEADVNMVNNAGATARHILASRKIKNKKIIITDMLYTVHAVGARRCPSMTNGCTLGCSLAGEENGTRPNPMHYLLETDVVDHFTCASDGRSMMRSDYIGHNIPSNISPGLRVLSLDGGGIRGLLLAQTLRQIEKTADKPVHELFDWVAGTSTGGILALCLAQGKPMRQIRALYFELKDEVFVGKRPYNEAPFEQFLKDHLGANTIMTDNPNPKVVVTGLLGDRFPPKLHLFRNYQPPTSVARSDSNFSMNSKSKEPVFEPMNPPERQLTWEAGRASGAAPTFFRSFGRFLDGGLIANNPTLDLLTEINSFNEAHRERNNGKDDDKYRLGVVVSVGTGRIPTETMSRIDVFRPNNPLELYQSAMAASSLGRIMVEMATHADGPVVERARAWCSSLRVPFVRLSPPITADVPLDTTSNSVLLQMLWECQAFLQTNQPTIDRLAKVLSSMPAAKAVGEQ